MAGSVALSQALSYARDLKSLYETSRARERELEQTQERLRNAYQQSLQYAIDLRKTYRRLHDIPDDWGTAVNVQAMVFGNL